MRQFFILFVTSLLNVFQPACADDMADGKASDNVASVNTQHEGVRADLLFFAVSLVDTAYKFGGQLPQSGLDCSGFVRYVFQQAANIHLPRTAKDISQTGVSIAETQLRPGDLVFFNTMKQAFSHVGIYLGNNRFIHAASSKTGKVMISDMTDAYWAKHYEGSRRIATVLAATSN